MQAYLDAMPGWKQDVGRQLDKIICETVPDVKKAVRWNTPFYGTDGETWFVAFHCMTKYIKVSFFLGMQLNPPPPVSSKQENVRYYHVNENDGVDVAQFRSWIQQASQQPGEAIFRLGA